jgi:hypothetical protein
MPKGLNFAEAESVAAIAMEFGRSPLRQKAYVGYITSAGGFPEFYQIAISGARELEVAARQMKVTIGTHVDYFELTEGYATEILKRMGNNTFYPSDLLEIAKDLITRLL